MRAFRHVLAVPVAKSSAAIAGREKGLGDPVQVRSLAKAGDPRAPRDETPRVDRKRFSATKGETEGCNCRATSHQVDRQRQFNC